MPRSGMLCLTIFFCSAIVWALPWHASLAEARKGCITQCSFCMQCAHGQTAYFLFLPRQVDQSVPFKASGAPSQFVMPVNRW